MFSLGTTAVSITDNRSQRWWCWYQLLVGSEHSVACTISFFLIIFFSAHANCPVAVKGNYLLATGIWKWYNHACSVTLTKLKALGKNFKNLFPSHSHLPKTSQELPFRKLGLLPGLLIWKIGCSPVSLSSYPVVGWRFWGVAISEVFELDYSPDSCLLADIFSSLGPRSTAPLLELINSFSPQMYISLHLEKLQSVSPFLWFRAGSMTALIDRMWWQLLS